MKAKATWFALLLIASALVITGCNLTGGNPGDDWATFENPVYGYSFKYPVGCFIGPMPSDCKEKPPEERNPECLCFLNSEDPNDVYLQAYLGEGDQLSLAGFRISHHATPLYHPPADAELIEWVGNNFMDILEDIPEDPNMKISGVQAVRIYAPGSPMATSYEEIYFIRDGSLMRINLIDVGDVEKRALYEQMLSTFKLEE
ncbi:MAG: hypothetical protein GTO14_19255 [Anaerolineales bacterium]|nr:hypothetical protein [Anaerolineales bacterium]